MKVVLFGASGMIGSRVLAELVSRGHKVTAVARDVAKIKAAEGVTVVAGDANDPASVAAVANGADAAVGAIAPSHENPEAIVDSYRSLLKGLAEAGVKRLIVVGGAGSLEIAPGLQLVDAPDFPAAWLGIARAHRDVLPVLKESEFDWSYFSPAALIQPGERTGEFRLGTTRLVATENGESKISAEDYAVALVDELETPKHVRQQLTIAY